MPHSTLTLEEDEGLPLDVRGVGNSEFAVQSGLGSDVVDVHQYGDGDFVGGVLQAVDVHARVDQRVASAIRTV